MALSRDKAISGSMPDQQSGETGRGNVEPSHVSVGSGKGRPGWEGKGENIVLN